jgi:hypothetical protein
VNNHSDYWDFAEFTAAVHAMLKVFPAMRLGVRPSDRQPQPDGPRVKERSVPAESVTRKETIMNDGSFTNRGFLSKNRFKQPDSARPDYTGKLDIGGQPFELAGW